MPTIIGVIYKLSTGKLRIVFALSHGSVARYAARHPTVRRPEEVADAMRTELETALTDLF
jgi:hypothetical protein